MNYRAWQVALLVGCAQGCDQPIVAEPAPRAVEPQGSQQKQADPMAPRTSAVRALPFLFPEVKRWVAIGDLHGDDRAAKDALRLAGVLGKDDHWGLGAGYAVQVGDQLDRGDGERVIWDLLIRLEGEAMAQGGRFLVLNGNHELMNAMGDFRYVTPGAVHAFDDMEPKSSQAARFPAEWKGRAGAFLPGGAAAAQLSRRLISVQLGSTVFSHAGIRPAHVSFGLERLNRETAEFLLGERPKPPLLATDPEGPTWTRLYGGPQLAGEACTTLQRALAALSAERLVIGHTVQERGVSSACSERVTRIDVGLSSYHGEHPIEVIRFDGQKIDILRGARSSRAPNR